MARYIVKSSTANEFAWWDAAPQPLPAPTVFPIGPIPTGILNAEGKPIWRLPDAIGFLPEGLAPTDKEE